MQISANNCVKDSAEKIIHDLCALKEFISDKLPNTKIIFCQLPLRRDNPKAEATRQSVNSMLPSITEYAIINNENIDERHLSRKGLHLNNKGTSLLAKNVIEYVRSQF